MIDLYINNRFKQQFFKVEQVIEYIKKLENIDNKTVIKASFNNYLHRIIIKVKNNEYGIVI